MDTLTVLTALELDVLKEQIADVYHQISVLTNAAHSKSFTLDELTALKAIYIKLLDLERDAGALVGQWRKRVGRGKESNRSDTGGTDAAGPARPGDDVPPSTAR